ncbi:cache domain-containing protein [Bacteriovorax sp. DB6_IX]|uniref:cache domain-containing protein n=1 Tax=Bacteriovorax sp. DB6_IX TaxID=1353530 RepID=UPI00038A0D14|nr:cache domain-containing protein [Bacteriovorax sp. DB6_IX]EQC51332.1 cache domain protein [Bacteriovorax sp. DB6_IX]
MKNLSIVLALTLLTSSNAFSCSKEEAKASVEKICSLIGAKGDGAKDEIKKFRYCGTNYVWVQDSDVKMVIHPIKGRLNGRDLKKNKDKKGKHLFVEFDKMAKAKAEGGWVDYYWTKPGEEAPTPKVSFVKMCPGDKKWIAGSGVWK